MPPLAGGGYWPTPTTRSNPGGHVWRAAGPSDAPPDHPVTHRALMVRAAAAARRAPRVLPGPIGEAVAEVLRSWIRTGYRFGGGAVIMRLCDDVLRRPDYRAPAGTTETVEAA